MDLCCDCHGFAQAVSQGLGKWPGLGSFLNVDRLRAESRNCRLCKMIYDYILDGPQKLMSYECLSLTYRTFNSRDPDIPPYTCVIFWGFDRPCIDIAVWSDEGN